MEYKYGIGQVVEGGKKLCSGCKKKKVLSEFWKDKNTTSGYCSQCKECSKRNQKIWMHKNKDKDSQIRRRRQKSYKRQGIKITLEEYDEKFRIQNEQCAICGIHQSELKRRLDVDHNHKTGQVRGLLCRMCNLIIEIVENNRPKISLAKNYLKRWDK